MYKLIIRNKFLIIISLATLVFHQLSADDTPINNTIIIVQEDGLIITATEAKAMLDDMNWQQKEKILSSKDKLKNLLIDTLIVKKKVEEAKIQRLDKLDVFQRKIKKIEDGLLVESLIKNYKLNVKLPENIDSLAKDYYDSHPEEFTDKEQVNVAHILISFNEDDTSESTKLTKLLKIKELLQKLYNGSDFAEMAKKYSDDKGSAKSGGVLGFSAKGKMVPSFEAAAFEIKEINGLSDIVESPFGYHIIKLLERKEAALIPYSKVKEKLINKQKNIYVNAKADKYLDSFRVNKNTTVYNPALDKIYNDAVKNKVEINFN